MWLKIHLVFVSVCQGAISGTAFEPRRDEFKGNHYKPRHPFFPSSFSFGFATLRSGVKSNLVYTGWVFNRKGYQPKNMQLSCLHFSVSPHAPGFPLNSAMPRSPQRAVPWAAVLPCCPIDSVRESGSGFDSDPFAFEGLRPGTPAAPWMAPAFRRPLGASRASKTWNQKLGNNSSRLKSQNLVLQFHWTFLQENKLSQMETWARPPKESFRGWADPHPGGFNPVSRTRRNAAGALKGYQLRPGAKNVVLAEVPLGEALDRRKARLLEFWRRPWHPGSTATKGYQPSPKRGWHQSSARKSQSDFTAAK